MSGVSTVVREGRVIGWLSSLPGTGWEACVAEPSIARAICPSRARAVAWIEKQAAIDGVLGDVEAQS